MIKNKFIKKKIKGIEIDVRSKKSLYIKMDGWTVYIDNSTNEHIIDHWYMIHRQFIIEIFYQNQKKQ